MAEDDLGLSSTYPRRELTDDLDDETLTDLGLASGVIVIRFKRVRWIFCVSGYIKSVVYRIWGGGGDGQCAYGCKFVVYLPCLPNY